MDTRQLEIILSLAEQLHFGRTADLHALSPSALSRLVQRIEEELGASLFERDNRRVRLTPAGLAYTEFAKQTLQAWQQLRQQLDQGAAELAGEVSLYCSVTASHSLLNPLLAAVRSRYSDVDIRVHTGDQALSLQRLQQASEDFVIAAKPDRMPAGMLFKRLSASRLVFIAPRGGPIEQRLIHGDSAAWAEVPWILAERGLSRSRLDSWFRGQGIRPEVYAQVSGHEAIASMVSLGFGVGLVPELVLSNSPVSDKIRVFTTEQLPASEAFAAFEVGLCVLKRKLPSPLIAAIWDLVEEQ